MRLLLAAPALLAALLASGWARYQLAGRERPQRESLKEVLLVPPGAVIRRLDLGYHTLAADLLFIRANLYYGQHMLGDQQLPWLASFIDSLIEVDPDFRKAYEWGAMATVFYKRQIDHVPPELIQRANRILARGMQRFPGEHAFPMRIGYNLYYELGDTEAAIPYFVQAAAKPDAPEWLEAKLSDLLGKVGQRDLARRVLAELMVNTEDPQLAAAMRDRMDSLFGPGQRERVEAARRDLMEAWQARWAYLPYELFLLVRVP